MMIRRLAALLLGITALGLHAQSIRGIFHGASFAPAQLDGVAPGSAFAILGTGLPSDKAEVQVAIQGQLVTVIEAASDRVVALLPATVPVGVAQVQIRIGTRVSQPIPFIVTNRRPGVFTQSKDGRATADAYVDDKPVGFLNPVKNGQVVTVRMTGVGQGEPEIKVRLGKSEPVVATLLRSADLPGVDLVTFTVPQGDEEGCYLPLTVRVGDLDAPPVTLARGTCTHPLGLSEDWLRHLDSGGVIGLGQLVLQTSTNDNGRVDAATASFLRVNAGELFSFAGLEPAMIAALPDRCQVTQQIAFLDEVINDEVDLGGIDLPDSRRLDAGASIQVASPAGSSSSLDRTTLKTYGRQLTVTDGEWRFSGPGGPDVGEFSTTLPVGRSITWDQNFGQLIDTRSPLELNWTVNGEFDRESLIINGYSGAVIDANFAGVTSFSCIAPVKDGKFTIPQSVLDKLFAANVQPGFLQLTLYLGPQPNDSKFTANALDVTQVTRQFIHQRSRFYRN